MSAFNFPPCYPKLRLLLAVLQFQTDTSGSINRMVSKQMFQLNCEFKQILYFRIEIVFLFRNVFSSQLYKNSPFKI